MSIQIAVRLPDDLLSFVDEEAGRGRGSRAAVVTTALRELQRRRVAERDAEILRADGDYADFADLAAASPALSDLD